MQLKSITTDSEFAALRSGWRKLEANALHSFEWNYAWWQHLGTGELEIFAAFDKRDELLGIAPFFRDQWLGQSRLRFLGSGVACTDYLRVLSLPEHREDFVYRLGKHIGLSRPALIEFEGIDQHEVDHPLPGLRESGYWNYTDAIEPSWALELPDTWEEFVRRSNKSLKRKIKKAVKRLDSGEFPIEETATGADFEKNFEVFVQLHQQRFVDKGEAGVFADRKFTQFLQEAAGNLCAQGRANLVVIFVGSAPLSAHLYLDCESGPQMYQSGAAIDRMDLEPGHLMITHMVRKTIEQGFRRFDFLRGDEPYKKYWGAERIPLFRSRSVSRGAIPTATVQSFRMLKNVKHSLVSWVSSAVPSANA